MKIIFYLGVLVAIAGIGLHMMDIKPAGAILVCIGVAAAVIGFGGLIVNAFIDQLHLKKKK